MRLFSSGLSALVFILMVSLAGCQRNTDQSASSASVKLPISYITTFQFTKPDRVVIEYYNKVSDLSDSISAEKRYELTDGAKIEELMALAGKLSDKGEIMVKLGDVPVMNVILVYATEQKYFTFYQNMVKAPDTAFFTNFQKDEKKLHGFLFALLNESK